MITIANTFNQATIFGLSTDEKPIGKYKGIEIKNSYVFYEMNTKKSFIYDEENEQWLDM